MKKKRKPRAKPIKTKAELVDELGVAELVEIVKDPLTEAKFLQLAPEMSPELLAEVLKSVPELARGFGQLIASMGEVGKTLERSKQARWEALKELAKTGKMTADQILEAMRIIAEIEKKETINWTDVFKAIASALGLAVGLVIAAVVLVTGVGRESGGSGRST